MLGGAIKRHMANGSSPMAPIQTRPEGGRCASRGCCHRPDLRDRAAGRLEVHPVWGGASPAILNVERRLAAMRPLSAACGKVDASPTAICALLGGAKCGRSACENI